MKKRQCSYKDCKSRRVHYERQDIPRGIQYVEVPDDYSNDLNVYCSFTCAIMDGSYDVKTGWIKKKKENKK